MEKVSYSSRDNATNAIPPTAEMRRSLLQSH